MFGHYYTESELLQGARMGDKWAIFPAAKNGYVAVLQRFIEFGKNTENPDNVNATNEVGCTALMLAAASGQTDIVQILLGANANVNLVSNNGSTALILALASDIGDNQRNLIVKNLLAAGANANVGNGIALILAAGLTNAEPALALLANLNANDIITARRCDGMTALHIAAIHGNKVVVEALLAAGAHIDAVDDQGNTPLMLAVTYNQTAIIKTLLDAANIGLNARNTTDTRMKRF